MIEKKIITDHVPCSERNNNEEYLVQHFDRCQLEIEQSAACSDFSQICFMKKKLKKPFQLSHLLYWSTAPLVLI